MPPLKRAAAAAILTGTVLAAQAQAPATFTDPANLRGERVAPRTGRELPVDSGALGLQQQLRRLQTRASLLLIVAHPDDEDGGMLTYASRGLGARVGMLTLTRGEGGQNAVTGDFEDALGLLRTQELLSADRYLGVTTQMFGTEVDFGFSKTKAESFSKWGHERVLYDAVRAIRLFRPMVIAAVFIGGVTDGHGQHQVSGEIAQEAFKAAADRSVFPDMIAEGILPWQASRVYARVPAAAITPRGLFDYATGQYVAPRFTNYVTGEVTTTIPSTDVVVHEGLTDPLLTRAAANTSDIPAALTSSPAGAPFSYVQFGRIGLGLQRSQVGANMRLPPEGAFDVAYHLYGEARNTETPPARGTSPTPGKAQDRSPDPIFFAGLDTGLTSIASLDPADVPADALQKLQDAFVAAAVHLDPAKAEDLAADLAAALRTLDDLITSVDASTRGSSQARASALHELRIKRVQLTDALTLALGVSAVSTPQPPPPPEQTLLSAPSHSSFADRLDIDSTSQQPLIVETLGGRIPVGKPLNRHLTMTIQSNITGNGQDLRTNYFYRDTVEQPVYTLQDTELRNAPERPQAFTQTFQLRTGQTLLQLPTQAHPAISIVPSANVDSADHALVLVRGTSTLPVHVSVSTELPSGDGFLRLKLPEGWSSSPSSVPLHFVHSGQGVRGTFLVKAPPTVTAPATLEVIAELNGTPFTLGYRSVGYPGLQASDYTTPATVRVVPVDLKLPAKRRIAYLPGTGDAVPQALAGIGLAPAILTIADLTPASLARFDTVVLGVRTYAAHPDLHGTATQALLDFAKSGGNVIVQYQTPEFTAADAPYPASLGTDEKVVDENAPVAFIEAVSPLLSTPNRLKAADFAGWIEERGHGFMGTWDARYSAPTETHDPGEPSEFVSPQAPQRGGLLTAAVGKGHWTYCSFALYRQLPEAVPGAFRLFANLLALADQP